MAQLLFRIRNIRPGFFHRDEQCRISAAQVSYVAFMQTQCKHSPSCRVTG